MVNTPYSKLKKGIFLLASPEINNGIFFRSVVLLCDHSPMGSFGLIVNKPLEIETLEEMLDLEMLNDSPYAKEVICCKFLSSSNAI